MCSPVGWVIASFVTAAASATVNAVASAQQSRTQKKMAEFQEDVARNNAEMANRHANNIERQADQRRMALRRNMLQQQGTARAEYASQGVVLGSGVVLDYEADIANAYDLDLRNLNYDVASKAWQTRVEGTGQMNQSKLYAVEAKAHNRQMLFNLLGAQGTIGSTVAGGAADVAWYYQNRPAGAGTAGVGG
jgi:hypothetical protein